MTNNDSNVERKELLELRTRRVFSVSEIEELTLSSRDRDVLMYLTEVIIITDDRKCD